MKLGTFSTVATRIVWPFSIPFFYSHSISTFISTFIFKWILIYSFYRKWGKKRKNSKGTWKNAICIESHSPAYVHYSTIEMVALNAFSIFYLQSEKTIRSLPFTYRIIKLYRRNVASSVSQIFCIRKLRIILCSVSHSLHFHFHFN